MPRYRVTYKTGEVADISAANADSLIRFLGEYEKMVSEVDRIQAQATERGRPVDRWFETFIIQNGAQPCAMLWSDQQKLIDAALADTSTRCR